MPFLLQLEIMKLFIYLPGARYFIRQTLFPAVPCSTVIKLYSHETNGNLSQGGKEIWWKDTIYI